MSTYDPKPDTPGLLRVESLNITLKFDRTGPHTGRISWNIPAPAAGCLAGTQAYCGIILTIDNTPINGTKVPTRGTVYSADPTADTNLFAGDKLGTSYVVGAFYNDRTTTYVDISGLTPNTPYYVSGFPTDCEYRYYIEGVHAYSLDYTNRGSNGTPGSQIVILNSNHTPTGVSPEDFTGLIPGATYEFTVQCGIIPKPRTPVDSVYCSPQPNVYTIKVSGSNSNMYKDLVQELNKQFSLIGNVVQSPSAPYTGVFYWDAASSTLYQWDGSQNVVVPAIIQSTAPNIVVTGTYWYNPTTDVLKVWNAGWVTVVVIKSTIDPQQPIADQSYWFDGIDGYYWNGTTWCKSHTIIQTTNPSTTVDSMAGAFWLDTAHNYLYRWDNHYSIWTATNAIEYNIDPNALPAGTYWFDETSNQLFAYNIPSLGWNLQSNVAISEHEPTTPGHGKFWYNPTTQVLKQWDGLTNVWNVLPVISFPHDPTVRSYCDVWLNTQTNVLKVWDGTNSVWKTVTHFFEQTVDPSLAPVMQEGYLWWNPTTHQLYAWFNNCFNLVNFVEYPNDPTTLLAPGIVWYNPTTQVWKELTLSHTWNTVNPVKTTTDPSAIATGTYWFNTSNTSLQVWNGAAWVNILFVTTNPTPALNTLWFDSSVNKLMSWNGITWILATPKLTAELDCSGNLLITDTLVGSLSFVSITDGTLFKSLTVVSVFNSPKPGTDGVSNTPSYNEVGIGTDGSSDQRLLLMQEIRMELGYPAQTVELTPEQLDYAITKALNVLRSNSGLAYRRGFFFMQVNAETQRYLLTNKVGGFNTIVEILGIYRLTSSFLSSAHGAGVYGQIVLQHLYNMGTFDLLSYHIMAEYTKNMEILFAGRLTFTWNEQQRELWIHHRFPFNEPFVTIEATVERTEQDIMVDRYARPWLRKYALGVARMMLAEIRGKFASLPGASGNLTLNSADLRTQGQADIDSCMADIFDYVAERPEEIGLGSTMLFG